VHGRFVGDSRHRRATRGRAATLLSLPETCLTEILSGQADQRSFSTAPNFVVEIGFADSRNKTLIVIEIEAKAKDDQL